MRYVFCFLILFHGTCYAQPARTPPNQPSSRPVNRELNSRFERYQGGSKAAEAELIRRLATKFAVIQTRVGAQTGGNKRGTHAKGFCLTGRLEVYDQKPENAWLQIGPFKKPLKGDHRPEVRIRFADAAGAPQSNRDRDVRAISFSFEIDGKRQDFSMNNDPVFTFGNLTDFNNYLSFGMFAAQAMPVGMSDTGRKKLTGQFFAVNPDIAMSVKKAMTRGESQKQKDVYAYHTENYYSGSAFSFGKDRAVKFSLVRAGGLPPVREKAPQDASDTYLVDRTIKAINGVAVPDPKRDNRSDFCFDLEVHVLDVKNMKPPASWPESSPPPTAVDWVEDATLDWIKAGAKSYKLARLTAVPKSAQTGVACDTASGFDVNSNCWDELRPLGNINRGRYLTERHSGQLRAASAPIAQAPTKFTKTKAIDQGWNDQDRDIFWYLPQGSYIIPYNWFMVLIDPDTKKPLRDGLEDFGFIHADYETAVSDLNRDKLPIGLTRELPPGSAFPYLRDKGNWLGITCAACHVGSVTVNGTKHIIDGSPSTLDFERFSLSIEKSLNSLEKDAEFKAFEKAMAQYGTKVSRKDVQAVRQRLADRNTRSFFHGTDRKSNRTVNAGPGRTDAFGIILNEVASRALGVPANAKTPSAPVSFPHLWGAPVEEWVQYSGLSNNAFTRNIGQVFGVFGDVILDPKSDAFLTTTARFRNLKVIEEKLRTLKPPRWEQVFGAFTADEFAQVKRGEAIFSITCANCHSENPELVTMVSLSEFGSDLKRQTSIGTDPLYFANLKRSWKLADTGLLKQTSVMGVLGRKNRDVAKTFNGPKSIFASRFSAKYGDKDNVIKLLADATLGVSLKYMANRGIPMDPKDPRYKYLTGGTPPKPQTQNGAFKARSLEGIAFTGPYFHNGSVRTLREVIAPEQRSTEFLIGGTGYDKENGGFENAGHFHFRANKLGNLNIGHDFGANLTAAEQEDLLMYLKSL